MTSSAQRRSPALSIIAVAAGALALVVYAASSIHGYSPFPWLLAVVGLATGIPALTRRAGAFPVAIVGVVLAGLTVLLCMVTIAAS